MQFRFIEPAVAVERGDDSVPPNGMHDAAEPRKLAEIAGFEQCRRAARHEVENQRMKLRLD